MNPAIQIYQTLLGNPTTSTERRDKTLAELRAIPQSDPRFNDARVLLQEFEYSESEFPMAKYPVPSLKLDDVLSLNNAYRNYQGALESETAEMGRLLNDGSDTALAEFTKRAPRYVSRSLAALGVRDFAKLKESLLRDGWTFSIREVHPDLLADSLKAVHPNPAEELKVLLQSDLTASENQVMVLHKVWPRIAESALSTQRLAAACGFPLEKYAALSLHERTQKAWHLR